MLDKRFMSKGAYIEAYTVRSMKVDIGQEHVQCMTIVEGVRVE